MGSIASQITSLTIVYLSIYSGADQRKYQTSASLAFVRRIHRRPVNSPDKGPVTRKMFPFWWRHDEHGSWHWRCDALMHDQLTHTHISHMRPFDIIRILRVDDLQTEPTVKIIRLRKKAVFVDAYHCEIALVLFGEKQHNGVYLMLHHLTC